MNNRKKKLYYGVREKKKKIIKIKISFEIVLLYKLDIKVNKLHIFLNQYRENDPEEDDLSILLIYSKFCGVKSIKKNMETIICTVFYKKNTIKTKFVFKLIKK